MSIPIDGEFVYAYGNFSGLGIGILSISGNVFVARDTDGWEYVGNIIASRHDNSSIDLFTEHATPNRYTSPDGADRHKTIRTNALFGTLPSDFATGKPFPWRARSGDATAMAYKIDTKAPDHFTKQVMCSTGWGLMPR